MASLCIMQFFFICPNNSFTTHYFNLYVDNIYGSTIQFFFNGYLYKCSADILWGIHIVINAINQIIAFFLLPNYLFPLTVLVKTWWTGLIGHSVLGMKILKFVPWINSNTNEKKKMNWELLLYGWYCNSKIRHLLYAGTLVIGIIITSLHCISNNMCATLTWYDI